ncbi:MAG TPA: pseudouridine synthase [Polyangiaceae bacterium]
MMSRSSAPLTELGVLGDYRGLLFVDKPAGLQTEPDAKQQDTLVTRIAAQLRIASERVHALSRLDTGVSGVVTLGLTTESRRLVNEWRERGAFHRRYVALASGVAMSVSGAWGEPIGRGHGQLRRVGGRNPEAAHTDYAVVASSPARTRANPAQIALLALAPRTGRTHQLRVHAAAHGLPLLGDRAYGGVTRLISEDGRVSAFERIALHAAWIEVPGPEPVRINSPVPGALTDVWLAAGGVETALASALATRL